MNEYKKVFRTHIEVQFDGYLQIGQGEQCVILAPHQCKELIEIINKYSDQMRKCFSESGNWEAE